MTDSKSIYTNSTLAERAAARKKRDRARRNDESPVVELDGEKALDGDDVDNKAVTRAAKK